MAKKDEFSTKDGGWFGLVGWFGWFGWLGWLGLGWFGLGWVGFSLGLVRRFGFGFVGGLVDVVGSAAAATGVVLTGGLTLFEIWVWFG